MKTKQCYEEHIACHGDTCNKEKVKSPQPTPTPPWSIWKERDEDRIGKYKIKLVDKDQFIVGELVATSESHLEQLENDADFILRAVNSHEALLDFARMVSRSACLDQVLNDKCICYSCRAKETIAQAEGK